MKPNHIKPGQKFDKFNMISENLPWCGEVMVILCKSSGNVHHPLLHGIWLWLIQLWHLCVGHPNVSMRRLEENTAGHMNVSGEHKASPVKWDFSPHLVHTTTACMCGDSTCKTCGGMGFIAWLSGLIAQPSLKSLAEII